MKEIFANNFILTGDTKDPRYTKYSYYPGFYKYTYDNKGDLTVIEYFKNYDEEEEEYSDLAVKETRVYYREATTGIQYKIVVTIDWYNDQDPSEVQATKTFIKPLDVERGYDENQKSRDGLLTKGTLYLFNALITADPTNGDAQAKSFLDRVGGKISRYKRGNKQPLLDIIDADTEPEITEGVKTTLKTILDIEY